jgi:hypothetical protein
LEKPNIVYCSRDCQKSYYIGLKNKEENYDNDDVVGFISADGIKFKIEKEKLKKIKYFKHMLNESFDNYLTLEDIDSSMMKYILYFLNDNLDFKNLDEKEKYQLLLAADFLNYTDLIDKLVFKVNYFVLNLRNLDRLSYGTILKVMFSFKTMLELQHFSEKFKIKFNEPIKSIIEKRNMLDAAAFLGKTKVLKMLLEKTTMEYVNYKYYYNISISKNFIKTVKFLLKRKIYPTNFQFVSACNQGRLEIVKLIANTSNNGIDPLYENNICFIKACEHGHLEIAKFLLAKGANPSDQDNQAFKLACRHGEFEIVKFLLDLNVIDVDTIPLNIGSSREILDLINSLRTPKE